MSYFLDISFLTDDLILNKIAMKKAAKLKEEKVSSNVTDAKNVNENLEARNSDTFKDKEEII